MTHGCLLPHAFGSGTQYTAVGRNRSALKRAFPSLIRQRACRTVSAIVSDQPTPGVSGRPFRVDRRLVVIAVGLVLLVIALAIGVRQVLTGPPPLASSGDTSPYAQLFAQVGPDGEVTKETALEAFSLAIAPLPGVTVPTGAPPTDAEREDGTFAVDWLRPYMNQLTPDQTAAVDAALAPDPRRRGDRRRRRRARMNAVLVHEGRSAAIPTIARGWARTCIARGTVVVTSIPRRRRQRRVRHHVYRPRTRHGTCESMCIRSSPTRRTRWCQTPPWPTRSSTASRTTGSQARRLARAAGVDHRGPGGVGWRERRRAHAGRTAGGTTSRPLRTGSGSGPTTLSGSTSTGRAEHQSMAALRRHAGSRSQPRTTWTPSRPRARTPTRTRTPGHPASTVTRAWVVPWAATGSASRRRRRTIHLGGQQGRLAQVVTNRTGRWPRSRTCSRCG